VERVRDFGLSVLVWLAIVILAPIAHEIYKSQINWLVETIRYGLGF
jgi:hypothetical protein